MHDANLRNISRCLSEGIECLDPNGQWIDADPTLQHPDASQEVQSLRDHLLFIKNSRLHVLWKLARRLRGRLMDSTVNQLKILIKKQRLVSKVLDKTKASLMILPADNRYDFAVFVKIGRMNEIPVCVFPAFVNNALEMAGYVKHDPKHDATRFFNRLTGIIFPKWIFNYEGRRLIHLPSGHVLAREILGLAPPLPWILHSGHANVVALECEEVRKFCVNEGMPASQLKVVGAPVHDNMFAKLNNLMTERDKLYERLNLPKGKRLILSALTPSAHNFPGGSPECDFPTYEELVEFWIKSLVISDKFNVVIALHPSMKYDDVSYIEKWGIKISTERTSDLIPLCDFYVASISSTIQWAIACGKPVLNYDVYRLRNTVYYLGIEGVITVEEKDQFRTEFRRLVEDEAYLNHLVERQRKEALKWGHLDGMAGSRILDLIEGFLR